MRDNKFFGAILILVVAVFTLAWNIVKTVLRWTLKLSAKVIALISVGIAWINDKIYNDPANLGKLYENTIDQGAILFRRYIRKPSGVEVQVIKDGVVILRNYTSMSRCSDELKAKVVSLNVGDYYDEAC